MKLNIFIIILFSSLFNSSSYKHPLKLTSSEIKYNAKTKSISMACKVFIDDFAPAVNKTLLKNINESNLTDEDKKGIENYFTYKYKISINGKILPLKFKNYELNYNVMDIVFEETYIPLKKGDKLYIENNLLYEEFGALQSNWVTLSIPPFVANISFDCRMDKNTYTQTL